MPDDVDAHVAMVYHDLISDLQRNDVEQFDAAQRREREARAALRRQTPDQGLTAGELLRRMDGNPEEEQKRVEATFDKLNQEVKDAAKGKDEPLPSTHFPSPPKSA